MTSSLDGRIHLEPGHRAVGESVAARLNTAAGKREAVKVECSDFDGVKYRVEMLDDKDTLSVSLATRNFAEIKDAVGEKYFLDKYPGMMAQPEDGYSITVKIALSTLPDGGVDAGACCHHPHPVAGVLTPPPPTPPHPPHGGAQRLWSAS